MTHRYVISQDPPALFIPGYPSQTSSLQTDVMKEILCRSIGEARKSFLLFAYVLMIDHLHVLTSRPSTTSDVLRVLKGLTARRVIDYLKENNCVRSLNKLRHQERDRNYKYSLWQTEKNVLPVYCEGMFMKQVNYIHQNPVPAGLSARDIDYRWSSARIWKCYPREAEPIEIDKDLVRWRHRPR